MSEAKPVRQDADPLSNAAIWALIVSIIVFPVALVAFVLACFVATRVDPKKGVVLMCLSATIFGIGLVVVALNV